MSSPPNVKYVPKNKIKTDLWDARMKREDTKQFEELKESIKNVGLLSPILVTEANSKGYHSVIAGRRRFKALCEIGAKEIPCIISNEKDALRIKIHTLAENLFRKNLADSERINGLIKIFGIPGYSPREVWHYAKACHNNMESDLIPEKFKETIKAMAYSPNFIYQLMQLHLFLKPEIFQYAEQKNLDTNRKILLTHTALRDHPELQRTLIDQIADLRPKDAAIIVRQMIHDLRTGAIRREGNSYRFYNHLYEKIDDEEPQTEKRSSRVFLDVLRGSNSLLHSLTGHVIGKGEYEYNTDHVKYSAAHRKMILNEVNNIHLLTMERNLEVLYLAIGDMLEQIDRKVMSEKKK